RSGQPSWLRLLSGLRMASDRRDRTIARACQGRASSAQKFRWRLHGAVASLAQSLNEGPATATDVGRSTTSSEWGILGDATGLESAGWFSGLVRRLWTLQQGRMFGVR